MKIFDEFRIDLILLDPETGVIFSYISFKNKWIK